MLKEKSVNMLKAKGVLLVFISALLFFMTMDTKYNKALGDYILEYIGIQTWSNGEYGTHLTVVYFGILFIVSLFFTNYYLNRKNSIKKRSVFFIFVLFIFLFTMGTNICTKNVKAHLDGLLVIGFEYSDSKIDFDCINSEYIDFTAEFTLTNYSSEEKCFNVCIISPIYIEDGVDELRFYNSDGTEAMFTLSGYETRKIIVLLEDYVIQGMGKYKNGSATGIIQELVVTDVSGNKVKLSKEFFGETLQK